MEATFKSIEFVRKREDCKTVIAAFHQKAKTAVVKKNYKLYQSVLQTVILGHLPDLLLRGNEIKRKGASSPDEQLWLEYFLLYEEVFASVVHQSWLSYMNQKYEKGDTILFKFLMLFLTENFYESWKASEPRSAIKTMVRNSILS
ncbi:MAG: hypothetical protein M9931_06740 [Chitinophagales bacterium]|nr:hypothetical protein [Chitinophagales bacterium]HRN94395.1 hypothetical protein [Chitinophagales bacterium]HRP38987.1 hypothetical protein [Chitinophagales bacterium]